MIQDDIGLLRDYSRNKSEKAFAELVKRHVNLVYSVALRQTGNRQLSDEITQSVFIILAGKAQILDSKTIISSWLCRTSRHVSWNVLKTEHRRKKREQEAYMQTDLDAEAEDFWNRMSPLLDEGLEKLRKEEHNALVLRYFEGKELKHVAAAMGVSEAAAKMKVHRALEKLRQFFAKRRIETSVVAMAAVLSSRAVECAPAFLGDRITSLVANEITSSSSSMVALLTNACRIALNKQKVVMLLGTGLIGLLTVGLYLLPTAAPIQAQNHVNAPADSKTFPRSAHGTGSNVRPSGANFARNAEASPSSPTAFEFYRQGEAAEHDKNIDIAIQLYSKSIDLLEKGEEKWPDFIAVYFSRAGLYSSRSEEGKAVSDYSKMLDYAPKNFSARYDRALDYLQLGQLDNAISDLTVLITDPDIDVSHLITPSAMLPRNYEYRGRAYERKKDYSKAIEDFTESIRLDPLGGSSMVVNWHRGLCYVQSGQDEKAVEEGNLMSENAMKLVQRNESKHDDLRVALDITEYVCRMLPTPTTYHLEARAAALAASGNFQEAVNFQTRALASLGPDKSREEAPMQARLEMYKSKKSLVR